MAVRRRTPAKSVLLSDDSSRLLLQTHFANERSITTGTMESTTTSELTMAAPRKKKVQQKLAMVFRCPCCKNAVDSVECRIDHWGKVAEASCWACENSYSTSADALTEPVDVYCEWIDERRRASCCGGRDCDGDVVMADA